MSDSLHRSAEVAPRARLFALIGLLVVVAAAFAVYLPTPGNYWIRYDNEALIRNSPQINDFADGDRLSALVTMFTSTHFSLYQPLFTLSMAIDHALFGWDLSGFHAHSVLLHALTVGLLFFVIFRLTGSALAAGLASLLIAVHPALVETVRWAICRNSQVAAVWLLLGVLLYLRHLDRPSRAGLWSSQAAFVLSQLGKVSPAIFLVPIALDLWRHRRLDRGALLEKVPLFLVTLLLTYVNYRASAAHAAESPLQRPWSEILDFLPAALALMTANTLAPAKLAILYAPSAMDGLLVGRWALLGVASLAVLFGGLWAWRRGHRGVLLGAAIWLALLLPNVAAGRFRATIASDRYLYLPILALAFALAAALAALFAASRSAWLRPAGAVRDIPEPGPTRRPLAAVSLLVLAGGLALAAAWGSATVAQTRQWNDEHRIWEAVNGVAPHHMAYYMLGNLALKEEKWTDAADLFNRALELAKVDEYASKDPVYASAVLQTSRKAASELAKQPAAESAADRQELLERVNAVAAEAAATLPGNPEIQFELGKSLYKQKNYREAITALDAALALDGQHNQALTYKAMCQYFLGEKELAIETFRAALAIRPWWVTYSNLGKVYLAEGRLPEGAASMRDWLKLDPQSEEAHKRFLQTVAVMIQQGAKSVATAELESYLASFPDSEPAKNLLKEAQALR